MPRLQATWLPGSRRLLFWSTEGEAAQAIEKELPLLSPEPAVRRTLVTPDGRSRIPGVEAPIEDALHALLWLDGRVGHADSLKCWGLAARLAAELGIRERAAPAVAEGQARWRAVLTRPEDRERFEAIARSLPLAARAAEGGPVEGAVALRGFLDAAIDSVYRRGIRPGPARGWPRALAEALSAEDSAFHPKDARFLGIPDMLEQWSQESERSELRLGFTLKGPPSDKPAFRLDPWLGPPDRDRPRIDLRTAWSAGEAVQRDGREWRNPAWTLLRELARASRIHPPLVQCLAGPEPRGIKLDPHGVWSLLSDGLEPLREAGFRVEVPEDLGERGTHRIRARMRVHLGGGRTDLPDALPYRWEVVLGDQVVDGDTFARLTRDREPVVRLDGAWILLDPAELARLPEGLPGEGTLPAPTALRAILTGVHEGVPVIADDRLEMMIRALRDPPEEPLPPGLQGTLRPYQRRGFDWLSILGRLRLGALLADDMGLGKTIQVIAHLLGRLQARQDRPSLVVCPTSVLPNWQHELARFAPSIHVLRHHGAAREAEDLEEADVVLTTYGLLVRDEEDLAALDWDLVVLDEAQSIKNPDSKRARAARTLRARQRVALTGTPVENRLEELWSLMEFLAPGLLGTRAAFRREVAIPVERFRDEDASERLQRTLAPFLLRRVKSDPTLLPELPDKIERRLYCPLTDEQRALYAQVVEEGLAAIAGVANMARRGRVLAMLTALKQVCNHPAHYLDDEGPLDGRSGKLDAVTELLETILDGGERALVFTQYTKMGERLQDHLAEVLDVDAPFLHGGVSAEGREAMVAAFQQDEGGPPILLVSLRAGGTGLNLTRASHVVHYDRWWNPAVEDQATDRAHRIGQRKDVIVHKLVTEGTLEERIDALLEEKRELAEQVVGSGEGWVTELDDDALRQLVTLASDGAADVLG